MVVENIAVSMFAGEDVTLTWDGIIEGAGPALHDFTGEIVKWAISRKNSIGEPVRTPLIDLRSDVSSQVLIPNPIAGSPHVTVNIIAADTATLGNKATVYACQLEAYTSSDDQPVMIATVNLTVKPNITNA